MPMSLKIIDATDFTEISFRLIRGTQLTTGLPLS
jgi:hypothetical protein